MTCLVVQEPSPRTNDENSVDFQPPDMVSAGSADQPHWGGRNSLKDAGRGDSKIRGFVQPTRRAGNPFRDSDYPEEVKREDLLATVAGQRVASFMSGMDAFL